MNAKLLLVCALMASILLLGCTGQQPAAQLPAQNMPAINARTGTNVVNSSAQQPATNPSAQARYTCALTLNPQTIDAGSSTEIEYSVQSKENVKFAFNCGNEVHGISTGGLSNGYELCKFDTPGSVEVWIKADGVVCAQQTLTVGRAQTAKSCYIDQSSIKRDLANFDYTATVRYSGFSPNDEIRWVCDYTSSTQKLGGTSPNSMPVYMDIECNYNSRPINDTIDVSIGGVSCGSISTR